ncbi:3'-5' exonuclease [Phormidium sp. LEGE 05292]|uniref:3'-5' exonuclease n=1 Tax=[Phormidium] sp. LEGE 05292 TaxID=767427 RepID=UPI0018813CE5|nr:3'-5' exonuclease [Phormidium sp. LEGE 05292]MBE9224438.1 3'-5' exonuclease [Phormidium sp. LEGE 05292]
MNHFSSKFSKAGLPVPEQVLIIDTETTDLEHKQGQVVEIGAILYSVKHQTTIQQFSTVLRANSNPTEHFNRINPEALSEIKVKQAAWGVSIVTAMAEQGDFIVAHNAKFHKNWFGSFENGSSALPLLLNSQGKPLSWLCTDEDFCWPRQTKYGRSLISLAIAHDIAVFEPHRALSQCQLIADLFNRMENLQAMFEKALRPKALFRALVDYKDREQAKCVGFKWIPDRKSWERKMAIEDVKELPFPVELIALCNDWPMPQQQLK